MITLYGFVSAWNLPDLSPFVVKIITYLRMRELPYQTAVGDPRSAPRKKLPYIVDSDGDKLVTDSVAIIDHLNQKLGNPLDAHLAPKDLAIAEAYRSMLEQDFYFIVGYSRWSRDEDFAHYRPVISRFAEALKIPAPLRSVVVWGARRDLKQQFWQQGTSRHSHEEIMEMGRRRLASVADYLGENEYFLGAKPTTIDATVYAFLSAVLDAPIENALKQTLRSRPNLVAYCDRMRQRYFSK